MRVTWFGHAAFLVEIAGLRVILDPYRSPDCGGYAPINETADIVVLSHENDRYHSHLGQIVPPFEVVRGLELPGGGHELRGLRIEALRVYETPERLAGDEVTVLQLRAAGRRLVFLGDLGHELSDSEIAILRGADVVLCPAGGPPTLDLPLAAPLLSALEPRTVVPMHYRIDGKINLPIQPVEHFLEAIEPLGWQTRRLNTPTFDLETYDTTQQTIVVPSPAR